MPDDAPEEEPEAEKPRFLLPYGCKDIFDVIRLQQWDEERAEPTNPIDSVATPEPHQPLPTNIVLPDPVVVRDLAAALHLKPFHVVGSLMQLNVFASLNTQLDFNTASALCSHYGVIAQKVG